VNSRLLAIWVSALCLGGAAASGSFGIGGQRHELAPISPAVAATNDPMGPVMPALASAEPPSPTVTPLPPPPVPPQDASGISATTPPIGAISPRPRPTIPDTIWLAATDAFSVRMDLHGGRPYVPVVVDGVRRQFLLDTLSPSAIDELLPADRVAGSYSLKTLQIGDLRFTGVRIARERLAPFSQSYLGSAADGVLGAEFFARYPVTIDYPARTVTIYRTEAAATAARPTGLISIPLQLIHGVPAVPCTVDDADVAPCFVDVNSDADLVLRSRSAEIDRLFRNRPAVDDMREAEPGREIAGRVVRARSVTLGSMAVDGPLVQLPASKDAGAKGTPQSEIGSGLLGRFVVTVDVPAGQLYLESSANAGVASQFDRSGLWLILRSNAIVVRSVERGSPGSAAGIVGGDTIVAVDGKAAQDLDALRAQLIGTPGAKVALTYQRASRRRDVVLTLRTLM
jgi:hypothetical protein